MDEPLLLKIRKGFIEIIFSTHFRLWFLIIGFICLIILRQSVQAFSTSLGYVYVILVSLAGFWFGMKGGLTLAAISSLIYLLELNIFPYWSGRELAQKGVFFRIFVYLFGGITIGYFADAERKLKEKLRVFVWQDELTGCVNFKWAMQLLENEIDRARRYLKELTIIMIDIDDFKKINDTYGHLVGNDALEGFANVIKGNVRKIDVVSRYGGEEFLIILPEAGIEEALVVLDRIKTKLSQAKITSPRLKHKKELLMRFSAGVASYPLNGRDVKELIGIADNALYQAKRQGKDRVAVERRSCIRFKPQPDLKIELADLAGKEKTRALKVANISKRGMLLLFPQDIRGEEFLCRIHFPEETAPSEFICKVAHKKKSEGDMYRVGVYFVDIPSHIQEQLTEYVLPLEELS